MNTKDKSFEQKEELFQSLVSQLEPVFMRGAIDGLAMITSKSVKRLENPGSWGAFWGRVSMPKPRRMEPRAELRFNINNGVRSLYKQGKEHHVYDGGITYPETETSPGDYIVLEASSRKATRLSLDQQKGEDLNEHTDRADRIITALTSNRYWYAIPTDVFSSLSITNSEQELVLTVTDREYARKLAKINSPQKSKWLSKKDRKLDLAGWIVMVTCFIPTFLFGYLFEKLGVVNWQLASLTVLVITSGFGFFLIVKANRGEPI